MSEHPSSALPPNVAATNADEVAVVDATPVVAYPDRPWVAIAGIIGAVALGGVVFASLISGQRAREVGGIVPTRTTGVESGLGAPVPEAPDLFQQAPEAPLTPPQPIVPEANSDAAMAAATQSGPPSWQLPSPPPPPPPPPPPAPVPEYRPPQYAPTPMPATPAVAPVVRPAADIGQRMRSPALIIDLSTPASPSPENPAAQSLTAPTGAGDNDTFAARLASGETATAKAGVLRNPKSIVPQGAIISAVLETAINSDLPGFVRAIVSQDVKNFDGSRVLIPRGSRLVGQYRSEVAIGQSRAFVIWTRLMRPDGVSVQIASPGTDTLGRAGLGGRVDRHYLQRFGPGLLTTAVSAALSNNNRSSQLVIGTAQNVGATAAGEAIKPTVTVAQGTAIQVFVARDLDFSTAVRPSSSNGP